MKIKLSGAVKTAAVLLTAAAAFGLGVLFERMNNERFIVETISYTDEPQAAETAETDTAALPEPTAEQTVSEEPEPEPVVNGKININTADVDLLDKLDGIGPSTAQKIIDYRTANGPFESIEELVLVSGIGEKKLDAIRDMICVE